MARQWSERKINFHLTLVGVNWSVKIWWSIPAIEGNCSHCPEGQNCGNSWFLYSRPKWKITKINLFVFDWEQKDKQQPNSKTKQLSYQLEQLNIFFNSWENTFRSRLRNFVSVKNPQLIPSVPFKKKWKQNLTLLVAESIWIHNLWQTFWSKHFMPLWSRKSVVELQAAQGQVSIC